MEKIDQKLKEIEALYSQKIANLQQTQQLVQKLTTECIGLEAKIQLLNELQNNESAN